MRNTFSCRSRSRAAYATNTPRSRTSFTASSLYSRLNFRRCIYTLRFQKHLISVSTKPAAAHTIKSELDTNLHLKGIKVADAEMNAIDLHRHEFHGECNYTIKLKPKSTR